MTRAQPAVDGPSASDRLIDLAATSRPLDHDDLRIRAATWLATWMHDVTDGHPPDAASRSAAADPGTAPYAGCGTHDRIDPARSREAVRRTAARAHGGRLATHPDLQIAPTEVMIDCAVWAAMTQGATIATLLGAIVTGAEVSLRTACLLGGRLVDDGWYPNPASGLVGAVLAAAGLAGLSFTATRDALGIAGTQMPVRAAVLGTSIDHQCFGRAAAAVVDGVLLARAGWTGPHRILDGDLAYPTIVAGPVDTARAFDGMGSVWLSRDVPPHGRARHPLLAHLADHAEDSLRAAADRDRPPAGGGTQAVSLEVSVGPGSLPPEFRIEGAGDGDRQPLPAGTRHDQHPLEAWLRDLARTVVARNGAGCGDDAGMLHASLVEDAAMTPGDGTVRVLAGTDRGSDPGESRSHVWHRMTVPMSELTAMVRRHDDADERTRDTARRLLDLCDGGLAVSALPWPRADDPEVAP